MVALLATVAFLQYRWTDEASAAAEMRIGAELESLMLRWHADLYGEFSAICTAMQVGPDSGARDTWDDYLQRYVEWKNVPPHHALANVYRNPDLIQDVYIWDTNLGSKPRLLRLNVERKKIEPVEIPQNLQNLLIRLRANSTTVSTSLRAWQLPGEAAQGGLFDAERAPRSQDSSTGWQFDQMVPAIVHPIFQQDGRPLDSLTPVDWMVVVLDANALQKRILPELAMRYFGGQKGLKYQVAVVAKGANSQVIYSSDDGFGSGDIVAADASLNVFGHQPETVEYFSSTRDHIHSLRSTDWHNFYGSAWFPVIRYGPQPSPWVLVLEHRADPLREVISRVRKKNLAVSAFLLLLLAANMTLLTIAGIRAQNFTKLQMDFVASVSHELRTPLTTIFAAAENIKDGVIREKSDLEDYGSMLMGQSRQLMDHVDRIMLFASMRSGKDRYNIQHLRVTEILQRVRRSLASLLIEQSFFIEETLDPDLPCILGDHVAVCSCLENLISNAIKYGGPDRRVRIKVGPERSQDGRKLVAISVEDGGMGIPKSDLKRIFEPFYRTQAAVQAHIPGTGLGLSVSKHLAEAMGGSLSVRSEVGEGSVFTLHLLAVDSGDEPLAEVVSQGRVTGHE